MPNGMLPPGYRAVLIGSAASIEDLGTVAPLEEQAVEGGLMLMRLDFAGFPSSEALGQLEAKLRTAGVPAWAGYRYIVYADVTQPTVYLAWRKAFAWMPIIMGILVTVLLPTLLGAFVWWLIPEPIKDMINMMVTVGVMMLMMSMMGKMIPSEKKPAEVRA